MKAASIAVPTAELKKVIESVVTSTARPEDILEQLRSCGIEWYITEKGALWIKYWQIGAEDFVPIERAAVLREAQEMNAEATSLEWVSNNLTTLKVRYPGKWIALKGGEVEAAADDLPTLMRIVGEQGIEQPFITQVPAEKVVWTTTYHAF